MTASFRQSTLTGFQENRQQMLAILNEIEEKFFLQKMNSETWSITEIVEHVLLVEKGIVGNLKQLGATTKSTFDHPPSTEKVIEESASRAFKASAPAPFVPKGIFQTKAQTIAAFTKHRNTIEQFVQDTTLDLKAIAFPHPRLGMYNGENWLTFMQGHCQRHIEQIRLVKQALE